MTGERAARYAESLGASTEARIAGLLHDLGKYSDRFTLRLEGQARGLDHWSPGAWAALTRYREQGTALALAIQGHHVGLQRGSLNALRELDPRGLAARHPLGLTLTSTDTDLLVERLADDDLQLPELSESVTSLQEESLDFLLDVRLLFSTLVDADYVETEAHFEGASEGTRAYRPEGPDLDAPRPLALLDEELERLRRHARGSTELIRVRQDLLDACRNTAQKEPGVFTLTAPTGSGKTLSMLAFALEHAAKHGLRRVVLAIPYLTIIEQTAGIYRDLFSPRLGPSYVLEHHSLARTQSKKGGAPGEPDLDSEDRRTLELLAENWDAPIVVTTNVQLLESLFSNRPSACRKLHRLAESVILLDEVQTLPTALAVPTLATLSRLAARFGSSVVFATATQPAFDHLDPAVQKVSSHGWNPTEIVPPSLGLFERTARVEVRWEIDRPMSWTELADRLASEPRALVIVNLKRHAVELVRAMKGRGLGEGLLHLSTNLCPAHRERVLEQVRTRLNRKQTCRLVATQCVEAGVDLDFPRVFRALGPFEAIAQAAGRCNRNDEAQDGPGLVTVFLPEEEKYPPGGYAQAAQVTRALWAELGSAEMRLDRPELFRRYFQQLYDLTGVATESERLKALMGAATARDFAAVAEHYRLINQDTIEVLVPYDEGAFADLGRSLEEKGHLTRDWIREARRNAVGLFRPQPEDALWNGLLPAPIGRGEQSDDWFVLLREDWYDAELLGLLEPSDAWTV